MACSISIDSVGGVGSAGGMAAQITVTGRATGCNRVLVRVSCSALEPSYSVTVDVGSDDHWEAVIPPPVTHVWLCKCNQDPPITVVASCEDAEDCGDTWSGILECESTCPQIDSLTKDDPGECTDGKRQVVFHADITGTPTILQWNYGDGSIETDGDLADSLNPSHDYEADDEDTREYTATLTLFGPVGLEDCYASEQEIVTIEPCPPEDVECPVVEDIEIIPSNCGDEGQRQVEFRAVVSGSAPDEYNWALGAIDNSPDDASVITASYPSTGSEEDRTYEVGLRLDGPAPCQHSDWFYKSFTLDRCCVPTIQDIRICRRDSTTLEFEAIMSEDADEYEWDFGDGTTATSTEPTISHDYSDSGTYTVTLLARGPGECESTLERQFHSESLEPCRKHNGGDGEDDDKQDKPNCGLFDWCCWLVGAWIVAYIAAAIAFYVHPIPFTSPVGIALAAVWAVLFGIWIAVCDPSTCDRLQYLFIVTAYLVALFGLYEVVDTIPLLESLFEQVIPLPEGNLVVALSYLGLLLGYYEGIRRTPGCGVPDPLDLG